MFKNTTITKLFLYGVILSAIIAAAFGVIFGDDQQLLVIGLIFATFATGFFISLSWEDVVLPINERVARTAIALMLFCTIFTGLLWSGIITTIFGVLTILSGAYWGYLLIKGRK